MTKDELVHAVKGVEWKNHKYIRKEGDRYIYPKDLVNNRLRAAKNARNEKKISQFNDLVTSKKNAYEMAKNNLIVSRQDSKAMRKLLLNAIKNKDKEEIKRGYDLVKDRTLWTKENKNELEKAKKEYSKAVNSRKTAAKQSKAALKSLVDNAKKASGVYKRKAEPIKKITNFSNKVTSKTRSLINNVLNLYKKSKKK